MPKKLDYPSYAFERCIELAKAVDSLGGSCARETVANKLGLKKTGSFDKYISSVVKFGLIKNIESGRIETTQLYKDIKLAYSDEDSKKLLSSSFLSPPTFNSIYNKFIGIALPLDIFEKMLIKEYSVDEEHSKIIAKNFISGLKYVGLLDGGNIVLDNKADSFEVTETVEAIENKTDDNNKLIVNSDYINHKEEKVIDIIPHDKYIFHIYGPGLDNTIQVQEEEDLSIVEAIIKKVKKSLNENINK